MTFYKIALILKDYSWVLLILSLLFFFQYCQRQKGLSNDLQSINQVQSQELTKWKDKAGKNRVRAVAAEIRAENIKSLVQKDLQKMLRSEIGNIKKNLIGYSSVNASTSGTVGKAGIDTTILLDNAEPLKAKSFKFDSKYLKLDALYLPGYDSLIVDYKVSHNFEIMYYYKRKGKPPFNLFRRKEAVAQIRFDNPGSQADSVYTIILKRKKGLLNRVLTH